MVSTVDSCSFLIDYKNLGSIDIDKTVEHLKIINATKDILQWNPNGYDVMLMKYITNGGLITIEFHDILSEDDYKKVMQNMKFAGMIMVKMSNNNTITAKKKQGIIQSNNPWQNLEPLTKTKGINVDDLIDPFDSYQKMGKDTDCMTRPKPCKNCTCGRAEAERLKEQGKVSNEPSNCGRCYLGDAFRCANCPYRGQPAFQPGDKVMINTTNETKVTISEDTKVKVTIDNKVKLDLDG